MCKRPDSDPAASIVCARSKSHNLQCTRCSAQRRPHEKPENRIRSREHLSRAQISPAPPKSAKSPAHEMRHSPLPALANLGRIVPKYAICPLALRLSFRAQILVFWCFSISARQQRQQQARKQKSLEPPIHRVSVNPAPSYGTSHCAGLRTYPYAKARCDPRAQNLHPPVAEPKPKLLPNEGIPGSQPATRCGPCLSNQVELRQLARRGYGVEAVWTWIMQNLILCFNVEVTPPRPSPYLLICRTLRQITTSSTDTI